MSEPQHPHPQDTGTHAGHPAPAAARAVVQPAVQAGLDSLMAVGARLTQLRESKNWSIDDVSARLKVSSAKLRALEAGDISQLPDTTFALGVVRSYAKMLGADPAPFTQAMRREKGVPEPDLSMPASSGKDLPRGRVSLSLGGSGGQKHRSWLWGIAAVIVAVIALGMWHTNGGDSSAWLARLRASANGAAGNASGASGAVAQGQTGGSEAVADEAAPAASAPDEGQAATDNAASAAQLPAPLPTADVASSAAPVVAAPKAASQATAQANAQTTAQTAAMKAASAPIVATTANGASAATEAAAGESIVAVRVTQDSWFSVRQSDGKEVFSGLVHAGDSKEVSGVGPFKVTVGNKAGLESMTLDGQPVDPAKYSSAKGNVARLTLP
ncbi:helix-turn-helix domain-containing protein [Paraburkholderia phenazinium]|uniref:Cytoskeleton protein RodZ n=1 Tax=Paraburkholderia phenazinium TaxID=60549 RepID=A0A1N6KUP5_9BURK|nr:helix-turn-helix domain-containing protein [Paraburkholderia phenazinium]SIO60263.1 cytoskeleton protein RodZ [Paraburkholderia phenazinium]